MDQVSLDSITLTKGNHEDRSKGMCLMEAVAYFAGEVHSDHPQCACPVLTSYGITLNDRFPDEKRQELKKLIPQLIGTRKPALEQKRMFFLLDKAVRVFTPIALRNAAKALIEANLNTYAVMLEREANTLESLPVVDSESAARSSCSAWSAARSATRSAEAAGQSAWYAARSAIWSAEYAGQSAEYAIRSARYAAEAAEAGQSAEAIEIFAEAIAIGN